MIGFVFRHPRLAYWLGRLRGWQFDVAELNNCFFWAMYKWITCGGYLAIRHSRHGPFPHYLWSTDAAIWYSFVPVEPHRHKVPPFLFRGKIVEGN